MKGLRVSWFLPFLSRGRYHAYMHPAQPKWLEPDVTVRLSRVYGKVINVLDYTTLNSKVAYSARALHVANVLEKSCQASILTAQRFAET